MHIYDPQAIEVKWQKRWKKNNIFKSRVEHSLKKYYLLEMFPYPSGRIHMGHVRVYTIGDIVARYKKMCGFNVLHPMGWDSFGMPAENAAIASNTHPASWTYQNIHQMRVQLKRLGFSYDWEREITTCNPEYYRWEQWLFIKMLENGMAYREKASVNWCESCKTVLANEQVENNSCWRCGQNVVQKKLRQWFLRITDYADDLLIHCDELPGWPEKVTMMQKNWIGKSLGVKVDFSIENSNSKISVFTTRPDTIFGSTFVSLASEHPMVLSLAEKSPKHHEAILDFVERISLQDRSPKTIDTHEKEGVFTGSYCINPANKEIIPIYVVNFVLMGYGTGAVMSVPAHDQRDFDFAKKYSLPIRVVIDPKDSSSSLSLKTEALTGKGTMVNSGPFNELDSDSALERITKYLEEKGLGRKTVSFRLRDWGISRQRYWGAPIPVVYCNHCGTIPVKEESLPVVLPEKADLLSGGLSPLPTMDEFINTSCPNCGQGGARRETDTMDTFMESSWYFERFCSPFCDTGIFDKEAVKYWMPVDRYVGGIEHAILHLLYARYITRILKKLDLIDYKEPFSSVITQGMVCKETFKCSKDGFIYPENVIQDSDSATCSKCGEQVEIGRVEKMSKSKKNIVDPSALLDKYGADTLRLFCLFAAPPEKDLEWSEQGVEGSLRFLNRVWRIIHKWLEEIGDFDRMSQEKIKPHLFSNSLRELLRKTHWTIKKVTDDIEKRSHFNTAISSIMELVNTMYAIEIKCHKLSNTDKSLLYFVMESAILLLNPIAPHLCEELWEKMGNSELLIKQPWPKYNEEAIAKNKVTLVIQVNGKLRSRIEIPRDMPEEELKSVVLLNKDIVKYIRDKAINKIIFVRNKLINIVVR